MADASDALDDTPGFLTAGGQMGFAIAHHDWSTTSLGSPAEWDGALKSALATLLASPQAMFLAWGEGLTFFFNDAYRPVLDARADTALGRPARELWEDIWPAIEPFVVKALAGEGSKIEDFPVTVRTANGRERETWWSFIYAPVRDETGTVRGLLGTVTETTEQSLARKRATAEREQQLRLVQQMPGFIAVLAGENHVYWYVNDAYQRIAGERTVVGRPARDVFPELASQGFFERLDTVYATGEPFSASALHIRLDGQDADRFIDLVYEPIRDDAGDITGIFVGGYDITDRVRAEHALIASEASAARVLDATSEAFYAVDRDGTTTLCNTAFVNMLGFASREAVIGKTLHDVIHHSHPDGSHYARDDCPIYRAAALGVPAHISDEVFFRLNGEAFPVEYRAEPIVVDGQLQGAICTFSDITERRAAERALAASEAEFRTLAQAMPNHVWASPPNGRLDWFNQRVYDYSGAPPGALDGTGWTDLVHPEDLPVAAERWGTVLELGEPYETEFRLRRADGLYRWHLSRAIPIRDAGGKVVRWIGTNTDIEDQKSTAEALEHLNATLERQVAERTGELMAVEETLRQSQKMEAVGQLTGGIAHDFNNMLAVVIGSLDLLNRRVGVDDPRARRYLDAAHDGAKRAASLTQRLLAFSRQQPLRPEAINPNRLVAGMSDMLRHSLGGEVGLETVLAGGVWRTHADPNQLENVILNLAVNARDAMPGGGRLTIETQNAHLDARYAAGHFGVVPGQYVLIAVSDSGQGMPQDVIDKAFDPFFTTKAVGKGTGLGLSQVYGFVKQSGGHIKIYSEPGQGTTVKVYLPRLIGAEQDVSENSADTPLHYGDEQELILVVEDEPAVRQFAIDALNELGYRTLEAEGAPAALRLLDAHPDVALLFTDVVMPDTNGRKLADEAVRRRPDLKVLFTTGYTRNAVVHNGVLDPGVELIGKPFTLEELAAKVRELLDAV
jgi:PAS domain S-box-containing protein